MVKTNLKYLKDNVRVRVKYKLRVDVKVIKQYLKDIDIDNMSKLLEEYNKFMNYSFKNISKDFNYSFQFKLDNSYYELFKYLDNLDIDIDRFIVFVIDCINKSVVVTDENNDHLGKLINKKTVLDNKVLLGQINSCEDDILGFFREFLIKHNPKLLTNSSIILEYDATDDNHKVDEDVNKTRVQIINSNHNLLLDIIRILEKNKIDKLNTNGYVYLELKEFYRELEYLKRYNSITSSVLRNILFKYKELCYIADKNIVSDELRYKILVNYFDLWILKTNIIIDELDKIGYRYDWDINQTKFNQAKYFSCVNANNNYHKIEKNNAYISSDKDMINEQYLLPFLYVGGGKHKSGYIDKENAPKTIKYNNEVISVEKFETLTREEKLQCDFTFDNKNYLNVYCDSETSWVFYYMLQVPEIKERRIKINTKNIIDLEYKDVIVKNEDNQVIELTRDEFLAMKRANIEYLKTFDMSKHMNNKLYNTFDNDNEFDTEDMVKFKWYAKSEIKVHQAVFVNERTQETKYLIIVDNKHKSQYGKDELEYTYKKKFQDKIDLNTVKAEIVYTDNVVDTFFEYLINWYRFNHKDVDSSKLNCRVWYHNLKFDSLSIGLQNIFQKYNWELKNYKTTTPVFYVFNTGFREYNRKNRPIYSQIEFIDSFNFVNQSLQKLGVQVGIRKEKEKVNFDWNNNLDINDKFLEYSLMDVVILKEFIEDLKHKALKYGSFTKFGAAGSALNSFYSSFYGNVKDFSRPCKKVNVTYKTNDNEEISRKEYKKLSKEEKLLIKKEKFVYDDFKTVKIHRHKNRLLEEIEQLAYYGGRTQVFRKIGQFKKYLSIDINSSYPSSMLKKIPYEYKSSVDCQNYSIEDTYKAIDKYFESDNLYVIARIYIPYDNHRIIASKRNDMVCFDTLVNVTTVVHEPELRLLLERNKDIKILEVHIYHATDLIFKDFVDEFMFSKSYHKSVTGDKISVTWSKLNANSLYGKFAEKELISVCREMEDYEIEFFRYMLSVKYKRVVSVDEMINYVGYVDIPLERVVFKKRTEEFERVFGYNPMEYHDIFNNLSSQINNYDTNLRVEFFGGYFSFSKKTNRPSKKASLAVAGAITSYSRVALYIAMEKLGFDRILYTDTDSVYFEVYENETVEYIKAKYFKEFKLSKDELKKKFIDKKTYLTYLNEVEEESKKYPDKIIISKGLVSKYYFWEMEIKECGEILTRGNKDNIKCTWINNKQVHTYRTLKQKNELIAKYADNEDDINHYIVNNKFVSKIRADVNLYTDKKYKIKTNEKNKGVSSKAILANYNTYIIPQWLSIKSCMNDFDLNGQYVVDTVKFLAGRDEYIKDDIVSKERKVYRYLNTEILLDEYNQAINNVYEIKIDNINYMEQIIEPYNVTNIDQDSKYYDRTGYRILQDDETIIHYITENSMINSNELVNEAIYGW
jgi:hypothetical protein